MGENKRLEVKIALIGLKSKIYVEEHSEQDVTFTRNFLR